MQLEVAVQKAGEIARRYERTAKRLGAIALLGGTLFVAGCATAVTSRSRETPSPSRTPSATATPTRPAGGYTEVEQFGANVFDNYQNASGEGQRLEIGQTVVVACTIYDPNTTVTSTSGLWYRLVTPKGTRGEIVYAAANTFWNQEPPQPPDQDNAYDPTVPLCSDSPSHVLPPLHG